MSRNRRALLAFSAVAVLVFVAAIFVLLGATGVLSVGRAMREQDIPADLLDRAAAKVMATAPAQDSAVNLRGGWADASRTHKAYVTHMPSGQPAILFVTWIGKGANIRGYLYYGPSTGLPVHTDGYGNKVVDILVPGLGQPVKVPATIERQVRPQWYYVSYLLD